jgi:hypothetical protein
MRDLTTFNFESVDNGRIASKSNSNKLTNIVTSIGNIKSNIPAKIKSRCSVDSILSGAVSSIESCKTSCDNISNLCEQMINLYKSIDYSTSEEIMKAFSQSLLLFDLGFLSLEDLKNLYERDLYAYDKDGKYVKASYEMILGITGILPIVSVPLGGGNDKFGYFVVDPVNGTKTRVFGDFAYRLQASVNVLGDLGIHIPLGGGYNPDHRNPDSLHRKGLAHDFDTGHAVNINYNNGADMVTIRQENVAISESANNVFYNTIDCSVDKMLAGHDYNRGLYAKIPDGTEIPEKYQKYIVTDLNNVVQSNDVLDSTPTASNISLVSIEGNFVDMNKLYADAGLRMNRPIDDWPSGWNDYEAHHVEIIPDYKTYPTGTMLSDYEAKQYGEIAETLNNLN